MTTDDALPILSDAKPADVFDGSTVRRKHADAVMAVVERTALSASSYVRGTMVHSSVGYEWQLPRGKAGKTPPFWGQPSSYYVDTEEARADILKMLGVDLSRSRIYKKYRLGGHGP